MWYKFPVVIVKGACIQYENHRIHGYKEPSFAVHSRYISVIARAVKINDGKRAWNVSNWMWPSTAVEWRLRSFYNNYSSYNDNGCTKDLILHYILPLYIRGGHLRLICATSVNFLPQEKTIFPSVKYIRAKGLFNVQTTYECSLGRRLNSS